MTKTRFLRDHTLDEMLDEIRLISEKVSNSNFPSMIFSNSVSSLSELYESNKIVLQHLEDAIEQIRGQHPPDEILDKIVEAAAHVQLGLVSVHNALKQDVNSLLKVLTQMENSLSTTDDNKG